MDNKDKRRVNGLANIGALLDRAELPPQALPTPKRPRTTQHAIHDRTFEKIEAAIPLGANLDPKHKSLISAYLRGAIREAHALGHAEALEQNNVVESLLQQQYDARTRVTMPAVVAGVMEQKGLRSMTLDLAHLATVFSRQKIDFSMSSQEIIEYRLTPLDEVQA